MAAAATRLSEPHVLAHTKRRLFPDEDETDTYAVVDTQFSRECWLSGEPIDSTIHETLAPFNHVKIGSGYPDLVGVRVLESDFVAVERFGDEPPLVAVDEEGPVAVAVSGIGIGVGSAPPSITLDRPFLFCIRDRDTDAVLFLGRVVDPSDA